MRRALLDQAVADDLSTMGDAALPAGTTPMAVLDAAQTLNTTADGRATLQATVQLVHELRNEGVADPVAALRTALAGEATP